MAIISEERKGSKALFVVIVLILSIFLARITNGHYGSAYSTSVASWIVTGTEVNQSQSIVLNGNLTVEAGGNLTLRNDNLAINVQSDGQYGILVEPGGSLYIYDSTIDSEDQIHRFTFIVNGSNFVMEGSTLQDAGWCAIQGISAPACNTLQIENYDGTQGPLVTTDNAIVANDSISYGGVGMILAGSHDVALNNSFSSNDYSSLLISYHLQPYGGPFFSNDTVEGNDFRQNVVVDSAMLYLDNSGGNLVQNNTFSSVQHASTFSLFAVTDESSWGNTIRDNDIESTGGIWIFGNSNDVISENTVTFCGGGSGIYLQGVGGGNTVVDNKLIASCGGYPLEIRDARDLTLANNTILSPTTPLTQAPFLAISSIQLLQTYDSCILNNNVTWAYGLEPSLYLLKSSNNIIAGNRLNDKNTSDWAGIYLDVSDNNTVMDNQLNSTAQYSIALDGSNDNRVYANDFTSNQEQAYDGGENNTWSFQGEGNYWGSYTGSGTYSIEPNGTDYHPLAAPTKIAEVAVPVQSPVPLPQPFTGNYSGFQVSNDTVIKGASTLYAAGGFDIKAGGNLTIENSDITMGTEDGGFNIFVESGGTFSIVNSNITWGTGSIQISDGGSTTISGSNLTVTGTQITALGITPSGSLTIENSKLQSVNGGGFDMCNSFPTNVSLTIVNSVLNGGSDCADVIDTIKIVGDYTHLVFENNVMENSPAGINLSLAGLHSTAIVINNTFGAMTDPIDGSAGTADISNNTVNSSQIGLGFGAANITMDYNTLLRTWQNGIVVTCGSQGSSNLPCAHANPVIGNKAVNASIVVAANGTTIADNTVINSFLLIIGNENTIYGNNASRINLKGESAGNTIYHNNILSAGSGSTQFNNSWSYNGEGNYWKNYNNNDPDLDGIGDTPYTQADANIIDNYPFMQPNGWLTKFYITVQTNLTASYSFELNGTNFDIGATGVGTFRLGYDASYTLVFPQTTTLPNGTSYQFVKWSDGYTGSSRTLALSTNSSIDVLYQKQIQQTTSTSITTSTRLSSSSLSTSSSSLPQPTTSSTTLSSTGVPKTSSSVSTSSSQNVATSRGGGIPEFTYSSGIIVVSVVIIVGAYLFFRRRSVA